MAYCTLSHYCSQLYVSLLVLAWLSWTDRCSLHRMTLVKTRGLIRLHGFVQGKTWTHVFIITLLAKEMSMHPDIFVMYFHIQKSIPEAHLIALRHDITGMVTNSNAYYTHRQYYNNQNAYPYNDNSMPDLPLHQIRYATWTWFIIWDRLITDLLIHLCFGNSSISTSSACNVHSNDRSSALLHQPAVQKG